MKRLVIIVVLVLLAFAFGQNAFGPDYMSLHCTTPDPNNSNPAFGNTARPGFAPSSSTNGNAVLYCDSASGTLKTSFNGGAYNNLGGTARVINQQGPLAPITGTGAVANAYTFSVPAQSTGTVLSVTTSMLHSSGSAAADTYAVTLNGQTTCTVTTSSFAAGPAQFVLKILVTGTTTATSTGLVIVGTPGFVSSTCSGAVTGLAWSGTQTLAVTFNLANTDQVTPQALIVESAS